MGAGHKFCQPNCPTPPVTTPPPVTTQAPGNGDCLCGLAKRSTRIVGGVTTEVNEYPWQIGMKFPGGNYFYCGGTLISDQWIMTAAHCTDGDQASDIKIVLGEHTYTSSSETTILELGVEKLIQHPDYDPTYTNFDFSLLKLESPVDFSAYPHIRPACLPESDSNDYADLVAITTGWGTTSSGGSLSPTLREVEVETMTNQDCKQTDYPSNWIFDEMMCAGVDGGGKDACQGDSGGPLITSESGDGVTPGQNYQLIGVTSWGYGCAWSGYPGVYSRITSVLDWIKTNIAGSGMCPRT